MPKKYKKKNEQNVKTDKDTEQISFQLKISVQDLSTDGKNCNNCKCGRFSSFSKYCDSVLND